MRSLCICHLFFIVVHKGQSDKMAPDVEVHMGQRRGIEFFHLEKKIAPLHRCLVLINSGYEHREVEGGVIDPLYPHA